MCGIIGLISNFDSNIYQLLFKTTHTYENHNRTYQSLIGVIPLQLLVCYLSIYKNINPDIPKNLAKIVNVE